MGRSVVLLSGGIDSTVCAQLACVESDPSEVIGLSFHYGQKHSRELDSAKIIAETLGLRKYATLTLPRELFAESGCNLIDPDLEVPKATYEDITTKHGPSPMYVPFRNGILLSMAASFALQQGADFVYYGAHSEDARNWAYPDCTHEFNGSMASAIYVGTYNRVRLITPLQWMNKFQIVQLGLDMYTPFRSTYSCYRGGELHCGTCATCLSRIRAFQMNFARDPVEYEIDVPWEDFMNLHK